MPLSRASESALARARSQRGATSATRALARSTSAAAACARADALSPVSRSYAASRNCRLELELAKQLGKPIVIVNAGDGSFDPAKKETYAALKPKDAAAEPEHPSEWLGKAVGKKLWHDFRTPAAATSSLVSLFKELHKVKADVLMHAVQEGSAQGHPRQQRISRSNSGASAASDPR